MVNCKTIETVLDRINYVITYAAIQPYLCGIDTFQEVISFISLAYLQ